MKTLALFPGQGSQKVGMGQQLFEGSDLAREMFEIANSTLGFSLSEICFHGPEDRLTETAITQPAILTVSSICFELAQRKLPLDIVAAAGHSLGEYSALVAAGSLKFEDAVLLVHKRGKYMQEAVPAGRGKMVAVLGKELQEIEEALKNVQGIASVANFNAPGQIIVSGSREGVEEFEASLPGAKLKELSVSAPFHCALMKPAEEKLSIDLDNTEISDARFPVYVNYSAQGITRAEDIRQALKLQVCGQVKWVDCMQNAIASSKPERCIEFGTGNVLVGMLKRIDKSLARETLGTLEELGTLAS